MKKQRGWKPIPLSLKIVSVLLILWAVGSIFAIPTRFESGLPFFGFLISGIFASLIVLVLDILAPLAFLIGLLKRKLWAVPFAIVYIGIFVLNSIVAILTVREQLGLMPVLIPAIVNSAFLIVIYAKRNYFKE